MAATSQLDQSLEAFPDDLAADKGEFGLDHFEGRGWPGFHHHAALCLSKFSPRGPAQGLSRI